MERCLNKVLDDRQYEKNRIRKRILIRGGTAGGLFAYISSIAFFISNGHFGIWSVITLTSSFWILMFGLGRAITNGGN